MEKDTSFPYNGLVDRVAAARNRLSDLKRELSASDFFCVDCRYLRGADCLHPAVKSYSADPVTGTVEMHATSARIARSEKGGCGPEAALFEPPPEPLVAAKAAWGGFQSGIALIVGAVIVLSLLAQFFL